MTSKYIPDDSGLDDAAKATVKNIMSMRKQIAAHPDAQAMLDEQLDLIIHQVTIIKTRDGVKSRMDDGSLPVVEGIIMLANLAKARLDNEAEIALNGGIISLMVHARDTGRQVEA